MRGSWLRVAAGARQPPAHGSMPRIPAPVPCPLPSTQPQTLRAYVGMLRMEDRLFAHPTYLKARHAGLFAPGWLLCRWEGEPAGAAAGPTLTPPGPSGALTSSDARGFCRASQAPYARTCSFTTARRAAARPRRRPCWQA